MSEPCQNNGSCVSRYEKNSYVCLCTEGYVGRNCETSKPVLFLFFLGYSLRRPRVLNLMKKQLDGTTFYGCQVRQCTLSHKDSFLNVFLDKVDLTESW